MRCGMLPRLCMLALAIVLVNAGVVICSEDEVSHDDWYVPGEVLVVLEEGVRDDAIEALVNREQLRILDVSPISQVYRLGLPDGLSVEEAAVFLTRMPEIRSAEPNAYIYSLAPQTPSDPHFANQWYLDSAFADIRALDGWDRSDALNSLTPSWPPAERIVAVLDTGIGSGGNGAHPDLTGKVIEWVDFTGEGVDDLVGHGTHVAGIIAGVWNNGIGIAGVCPNCKLLNFKVIPQSNKGNEFALTKAIDAAHDGHGPKAHIINASLGTLCGVVCSSGVQQAITDAVNAGVIFVAAAGNDGMPLGLGQNQCVVSPATCQDVLTVAATNLLDQRTPFTNWGASYVEIAAPGEGILSLVPASVAPSGVLATNGTSMAAPLVSGALGLLWGTDETLNAQEVTDAILTNALPLPNTAPLGASMSQHGRLDLCRAFTDAVFGTQYGANSCPPKRWPSPSPIGCWDQFLLMRTTEDAGMRPKTRLEELKFVPNQGLELKEIGKGILNTALYNGIGLHPLDGFVYGINPETGEIYRLGLGPNGEEARESIGSASGWQAAGLSSAKDWYSGTFTADGTYIVHSKDGVVAAITGLTSNAPTLVEHRPIGAVFADIAYDPLTKRIYGFDETEAKIAWFDPVLLAPSIFTTSTLPVTHLGAKSYASKLTIAGAAFFDPAGNLYLFGGTNSKLQDSLYLADAAYLSDPSTGTFKKIGDTNGDYAQKTDGTSCWQKLFMTKTVTPETLYYDGEELTATFHYTISNQSGQNLYDMTFVDELPTGVPGCHGPQGAIQGTYSPWPLYYDTGSLSPAVPCAGAAVSFEYSMGSGCFSGTPNQCPDKLTITGIDVPTGQTCQFSIDVRVVPCSNPVDWESVFENQATLTDLPAGMSPLTTVLSDWPSAPGQEDPTVLQVKPIAPIGCVAEPFVMWKTANSGSRLQTLSATTTGTAPFPLSLANLGTKAVNPADYDGIGYNPVDGYIYGVSPDSGEIYRIGLGANQEEIRLALGLADGWTSAGLDAHKNWLAGTFTANGDYVIHSTDGWVAAIAIGPGGVLDLVGSLPVHATFADLAFDPTTERVYGFDEDLQRVAWFDPKPLVNVPTPTILPVTYVGASSTVAPLTTAPGAFVDPAGRLYLLGDKTGSPSVDTLYVVDMTSGVLSEIGTTTGSTSAVRVDATSCWSRLAMEKTVVPEVISDGAVPRTVTYHFEMWNWTGLDLSGLTFIDTLPTGSPGCGGPQTSTGANLPTFSPWPLYYVEDTLTPALPGSATSVNFDYFTGTGCLPYVPNDCGYRLTIDGIELDAGDGCSFSIDVEITECASNVTWESLFENQATLTNLPADLAPVTTVLSDWPGIYGPADPTPFAVYPALGCLEEPLLMCSVNDTARLRKLLPGSSVLAPLVLEPLGKGAANPVYDNAIGYNPIDGCVYGIGPHTGEIFRIGLNANDEEVWVSLGLAQGWDPTIPGNREWYSGTFLPDGTYLIHSNNRHPYGAAFPAAYPDPMLMTISGLETNTPVMEAVSCINARFSDIAYDPVTGRIYGFDEDQRRVAWFDASQIGMVSCVPVHRIGSASVLLTIAGAAFFDPAGNLHLFGDDAIANPGLQNTLYLADPATGEIEKLGDTGTAFAKNVDGASCWGRLFLEKTVTPECLVCGTGGEVEYTYTIYNQTDFDLAGFRFHDTLPAFVGKPESDWFYFMPSIYLGTPPCQATAIDFDQHIDPATYGPTRPRHVMVDGLALDSRGFCQLKFRVRIPTDCSAAVFGNETWVLENQAYLTNLPALLNPVSTVHSDWPRIFGLVDPTLFRLKATVTVCP